MGSIIFFAKNTTPLMKNIYKEDVKMENKTFEGIHYSRFIASYNKVKGKIYYNDFKEWLSSLIINGKIMPEDVIVEVAKMATNGKLELQEHLKHWKTK